MNAHRSTRVPQQPQNIIVDGIDVGLRLAIANPVLHVHIFEQAWHGVDRARALVAAAGIDHRVHIHHRAALSALPRPA